MDAVIATTEAELIGVALGYLASWGSDIGLMALTLLVGSLLRSVGMVVVAVVFFLIVDWAGGLGLSGLGVLGVEWAADLNALRPGNGLSVWDGWKAVDGFSAEQGLALLVLFVVGFGGSLLRFQRMDIP